MIVITYQVRRRIVKKPEFAKDIYGKEIEH